MKKVKCPNETVGFSKAAIGVVLTILSLAIIVGGIKSISKVSSVVVPLMAVFYIIAGIIVIIGNIQNIPAGLVMIFKYAFTPQAVTGGVLGNVVASMMAAMQYGIARGCFSNEAGMGSALTIAAFKTVLGPLGGWLVTIGIALFAFSTILGWEYHGEKAFEYLLNTHKRQITIDSNTIKS